MSPTHVDQNKTHVDQILRELLEDRDNTDLFYRLLLRH